MRYLTATEAARVLSVNPKTVWTWIDQGKMEALRIAANRYAISEDEVERVKRERAQYYPVVSDSIHTLPDVTGVMERLEMLEQRVATLEEKLAEKPVASFVPPSSVSSAVSTDASELSKDMSVSRFAILHNVKQGTFWGHVRNGIHHDNPVQVSVREKPGQPGEMEYYVAPGDHERIYAYWNKHRVPFSVPQE